jgi:hypothetical protein
VFRVNKYHSRKITRDGETFDSVKEYRRWCELKLLEKAGQIKDLKRQVRFLLIPSFYEEVIDPKTGKRKRRCVERECYYVADFTYNKVIVTDSRLGTYRLEYVVEDTKGVKTKDYIVKRKLMLHVRGIRIQEV